MKKLNYLIKQRSKIHGLGIFTIRDIKKDEIFYYAPLRKISHQSRPKYAFIGNDTWISDKKVLNFVNHSCEPDTIFDISDKKPKLIAKRNIHSGEEITVNYNKTELGGNKVACNCKSKKCKKYFLRVE